MPRAGAREESAWFCVLGTFSLLRRVVFPLLTPGSVDRLRLLVDTRRMKFWIMLVGSARPVNALAGHTPVKNRASSMGGVVNCCRTAARHSLMIVFSTTSTMCFVVNRLPPCFQIDGGYHCDFSHNKNQLCQHFCRMNEQCDHRCASCIRSIPVYSCQFFGNVI